MARPKNTEDRRQQIVDGLLEVMAKHGYERASVAQIARAARLTPGLVHYHFGSKQEVLLELVARLEQRLQARVQRRLAHARTAAERLDAFIDAHLALGGDADPQAVNTWVMLGGEALRQKEVRERYAAWVDRHLGVLEELVHEALREQKNRTADGPSIAAALFAAIQGYFTLASVAPGAVPPGSAAPSVRELAHGMIHSSRRNT